MNYYVVNTGILMAKLASTRVMDALKGIGLNLYERRLWVALLARGTSTAGELSGIASVPRSRTYDVLQTLADKGFVVVQNAKPLRYVAIAPKEAVERAKKKLEEDLRSMQERLDDLKGSPVIRELNNIFLQGMKVITPEQMTGALKGKYSYLQQLDTMFRDANKNINIVTTPEGMNDLFSNHFDALRRANEKGVNIRIATTGITKSSDAIKAFSDIAEIRSVNAKDAPIDGRFAVVDGKQLILGLTPHETHETQHMAIWSKSEHASGDVIEPLFNLVWSHSKDLG